MNNYVIGLDQGTTGTFAALMNAGGEFVVSAYLAHKQVYPQPGWVEQDANELWHNACDLLNQIMAKSGIAAGDIAGLGLANQGESVLMWDRITGEPLSPVLVWQDTRTQATVEQMAADPDVARQVIQRTGLKLDSYFSASKIRWLLDHNLDVAEALRAQRLQCGTLDTWLIWKLTGGQEFVTDSSTASRTLLWNIHAGEWDPWLLDQFGIPRGILPSVQESAGEFGIVSHPDVRCVGVPILASLVDQPAAMVGQGCLDAGQVKATYGTGCFINMNTGQVPAASQHNLLTMVAWKRAGLLTYGLDGGVFTAAASLNWARDRLELISGVEQIDELCETSARAEQVFWIPAQAGLGAPYWDRSLRAAWLGVDLSTTRAQLIRAMLEGIAARVTQIVTAMEQDTGLSVQTLRADGGFTNSRTMMQVQADVLGKPVEVIANPEATTSGVCALAARASGLWESEDCIRQQVRIARVHEPTMPETERRAFLEQFDRAIRHLKAWHNHE